MTNAKNKMRVHRYALTLGIDNAKNFKDDRFGGGAWKITVKLDDGNRVWGTLPRAFEDEVGRGDRIQFEAGLKISHDDTHFGFFKRPTKMKVLGLATATA